MSGFFLRYIRMSDSQHNTGKVIILGLLLFAFLIPSSGGSSSVPADLSVSILSEDKSQTRYFTPDIEVYLRNLAYYHGDLYLSYHVYADSALTKELPNPGAAMQHLILDEEGRTHTKIQVDVRAFDNEELYIQFDVFDDRYSFWFSRNPIASFQGAVAEIRYHPLLEFVNPIGVAFREQKMIFCLNALFFVVALFVFFFVRKRKLLSFR